MEIKRRYKVDMKKKTITTIISLAAVLAVLALAAPASADSEPPKPVVKVNDEVLTEVDLQNALSTMFPAGMFHGGVSQEKKIKYRDEAVGRMIEEELLYQDAAAKGYKADKKLVADIKAAAIKRFGGKSNFKERLKEAGVSEKKYEAKIGRPYVIEKFIKNEIESKAVVTEQEIKVYYEENKANFMKPESRRLSHILVKVEPSASEDDRRQKRARAEEVLAKLKNNEDFAKLAWDYSDDPYRVKGGDMGFAHKGSIDPDLEKEVWKLPSGALSGIIETIHGYHVVRVEDIKVAEQLELKDVAQKIELNIKNKKVKKLKESLISELKAKAKIEVYPQ